MTAKKGPRAPSLRGDAVHIFHPEDGVRLVLGQHGRDGRVLAKQKDGCQGDAFQLPFGVVQNQPGAARQFLVRE